MDDRLALEAEFVERLHARWRRGAEAYGDQSFSKPLPVTAEEILAEVEDIAGWAFVMWVSLRKRLTAVIEATDRLVPSGDGDVD